MTKASKHTGRHPIGLVSRRTGLKPDVIRAWERRYGAIEPGRTSSNRRYYLDSQGLHFQLERSSVALSIVYPSDDPFLGSALQKLRRLIGGEIMLLAGGRAAKAYADKLQDVSAQLLTEMVDLRQHLRRLRE